MLSLYLHIPFCRRKCAYCAFYSGAAGEEEKEAYATALMQAVSAAVKEERRPLATLYAGGGTPALLGAERLCRVLRQAQTAFGMEPGAEITAELNPESTTPALLAALREAGVNRLSVGVQSLCDAELRFLGRLHSAAGARRALERCFAAGFSNVSADVMYGLPGQTPGAFSATLEGLLNYPLTHLSAYALQIEEGTPLWGTPPMGEEREEALYFLLCDTLRARGFSHYEISNFARPGFESRHNTAYWKRTDYLGLGAAAHSFWRGARYAYPADRAAFIRRPWPLCDPQPVERPEEEEIMLGLRLREGVPLSLLAGADLSRYRAFGAVHNGRFALNERGFYVSNTIIAEVLAKR